MMVKTYSSTFTDEQLALQKSDYAFHQHLKRNKIRSYENNILTNGNRYSRITTTNYFKQHEHHYSLLPKLLSKQYELVDSYEKQILIYLKQKQPLHRICPAYLKNQKSIPEHIRTNIVKYYIKIAKRFKLKRCTIFSAVYYFDSFLQKNNYIQTKLVTILAQTCLFISIKYQQINPPQLNKWTTQSSKQIIMMQAFVLKTLHFDLNYNSIQTFLQFYLSKLHLSQPINKSIQLLADITLFSPSAYEYPPSQLSLGIIYLILNQHQLDIKMKTTLTQIIKNNIMHFVWLQKFQSFYIEITNQP